MFDHERLDVYRLAVEDTAESFGVAKTRGDFIVTLAINESGHETKAEHEHRYAEHEHEAEMEPRVGGEPLPVIGLPLGPGRPDLPLDLAAAFRSAYDLSHRPSLQRSYQEASLQPSMTSRQRPVTVA